MPITIVKEIAKFPPFCIIVTIYIRRISFRAKFPSTPGLMLVP